MPCSHDSDRMTAGIAQIAPVWLDREKTLVKIIEHTKLLRVQGVN